MKPLKLSLIKTYNEAEYVYLKDRPAKSLFNVWKMIQCVTTAEKARGSFSLWNIKLGRHRQNWA